MYHLSEIDRAERNPQSPNEIDNIARSVLRDKQWMDLVCPKCNRTTYAPLGITKCGFHDYPVTMVPVRDTDVSFRDDIDLDADPEQES